MAAADSPQIFQSIDDAFGVPRQTIGGNDTRFENVQFDKYSSIAKLFPRNSSAFCSLLFQHS